MKTIICPNCGEVTEYGLIETIRRTLLFDADGEPNGATDGLTVYSSMVKRCIRCGKKIKIVEEIEQ